MEWKRKRLIGRDEGRSGKAEKRAE